MKATKKAKDAKKKLTHQEQTAAQPSSREQEGFQRAFNVPKGGAPACSSCFSGYGYSLNDFRGDITNGKGDALFRYPAHRDRHAVEWETSPAESNQTTIFTWIGGSQVRPAFRPSFPYAAATLYVDGVKRLEFPMGRSDCFTPINDIPGFESGQKDFLLHFEPRRFQSLAEPPHRMWTPHGVSGFYRLTVPGKYLKKGRPLRLRVELPPSKPDVEMFFYVSPRRDALREDISILRREVAQLQADMVQLKLSHEMLYAQAYPQLFSRRVRGQLVIAHQDDTKHLHPAQVTVMSDGEIVITAREGTDHLAPDGRMILVRSKDHGRTWGPKEVMYDLGNADHRCAVITELPNGDWVALDYRSGGAYTPEGIWDANAPAQPTLWGAWSADRGRTWNFSKEPVSVPGAHPMAEVERHMIRLPNGRLLVAANYEELGPDGKVESWGVTWIAIFRSDDNGRSWQVHGKAPFHPSIIGECAMLRTLSGKLLLISRSEAWHGKDWTKQGMLHQSVSLDEGKTWSEFVPTEMSSMSSPGHLLQLKDGRILCTHASRNYPGSVYVTVSRDEGQTWDTANTRIITHDIKNYDSCYPNSGQMADGTLITVWYANLFGKFYISAFLYRPEDV
ncbi:MAG: exo-alpha-sialidase [Verrucomicrobia bacterium]|nr:exo-alpha-sialidase [Verrucomicrobiota bacterium]